MTDRKSCRADAFVEEKKIIQMWNNKWGYKEAFAIVGIPIIIGWVMQLILGPDLGRLSPFRPISSQG